MNNAKKPASKTEAKKGSKGTETAKKQSAKPTDGKAASANGNANKKSDPTAIPAINATQVYRVDQKGSPLRVLSRSAAIKDALEGGEFNEETLNSMLDRGRVIFSKNFYYATKSDALKKWTTEGAVAVEAGSEKPAKEKAVEEKAPEEPAKPKIKRGDRVFLPAKRQYGKVVGEKDNLSVTYPKAGSDKLVKLTDDWVLADGNEGALVPTEPPVEGQIIPNDDAPMSKEEKAELAQHETIIENAQTQFESAPMVMGKHLNEIRVKKLHRGTNKNFGEYVFERFGIARAYAQNLAQLSGYHAIAIDSVKASNGLELTVNTTNQLVRGLNRFTRDLGLQSFDGFEPLQPVIKNTMRLLVDIAPKDKKTGKPTITPRLVQTFDEKLREIITGGVVHLEGQAMTIEEANQLGVLHNLAVAEIVEATAESIQANRETIRSEAKAAYERQIAPQENKDAKPKGPKQYYTGAVPTLDNIKCAKHGETKIISIGTGKIQTKCKCRWHIDSESGDLVCFEVNGKTVKQSA